MALITHRAALLVAAALCTSCARSALSVPEPRPIFDLVDGGGRADAIDRGRGDAPDSGRDAPVLLDTPIPDASDTGFDGDGSTTCPWQPYNEGLVGGQINTAAFDPRVPGRAFASAGDKIYASDDYGASWSLRGRCSDHVYQFAFPTDDDNVVVAATAGGFQRSPDRGATWALASLSGLSLVSLTVNRGTPQRVYAGTVASGVFVSSNGGSSWSSIARGFPLGQVTGLVSDPADPNTVVAALVLLGPDGGWSTDGVILRSTTGGSSWDEVASGTRFYNLVGCASNSSVLYAASLRGLYRSRDGGITWSLTSIGATTIDVAVTGSDCDVVYASVWNDGIRRSSDGGETWSGPATGARNSPIVADGTQARMLLGPSTNGLLRSDDSSASWAPVDGVSNMLVRAMSSSRVDPGRVWLASWGSGLWTRASEGVPWHRVNADGLPDFVSSVSSSPSTRDLTYVAAGGVFRSDPGAPELLMIRGAGVNPQSFAFDPVDPDVMYVATQIDGIYKSSDRGGSWVRSSGMLTPWDTSSGTFIDIRAVWVDASNHETVFAGTNGRGLFVSHDGGLSWDDRSPLNVPAVTCLTQDASGALYACAPSAGVFRSDDHGMTWRAFNSGLPSLNVSLTYDPDGDALFAVGNGLFRLRGSNWESVDIGCLPEGTAGQLTVVSLASGRALLVTTSEGPYALPL